MEERTPDEIERLTTNKQNADDDGGDDDTFIEDVTPIFTKEDLLTIDIVPGLTTDQEQETGQPPTYDSRWTIRKCFTDIPMTHRSFDGPNQKTLRYELQGDSGANCTATDREELLWRINYFDTPVKVKTFDGDTPGTADNKTLEAIGAGTLKMVDDNNHIMDYYCLLIPRSTGTVISLDKFMRDNRSIVKFHQVGTVYGTGSMKFYDKNDNETHTVTMEERNGLWFASNPILMPPTSKGPTKRYSKDFNSPRINKLDTTSMDSHPGNLVDEDIDAQQFYAMTPTTLKMDSIPETKATNDVYELLDLVSI
jgi:hypothetical protein